MLKLFSPKTLSGVIMYLSRFDAGILHLKLHYVNGQPLQNSGEYPCSGQDSRNGCPFLLLKLELI